jgi:hypothetical protein
VIEFALKSDKKFHDEPPALRTILSDYHFNRLLGAFGVAERDKAEAERKEREKRDGYLARIKTAREEHLARQEAVKSGTGLSPENLELLSETRRRLKMGLIKPENDDEGSE